MPVIQNGLKIICRFKIIFFVDQLISGTRSTYMFAKIDISNNNFTKKSLAYFYQIINPVTPIIMRTNYKFFASR